MFFFKFAYKQSKKGIGWIFLFSLLLTLITTFSIAFILIKQSIYFNTQGFFDKYDKEYGCQINNYQMTCNENKYEFDGFLIDLNYPYDELTSDYRVILTKDAIITNEGPYLYEDVFADYGILESDLTLMDLIDKVNPIVPVFIVLSIIFTLIGLFIAYLIGNFLLALIIQFFINVIWHVKFKYQQIYKLTMVTVIPYVLLNALTRMILSTTLSRYLSSFIPKSFLASIIIDYLIIFGLSYLAVKDHLEDYKVKKANVVMENVPVIEPNVSNDDQSVISVNNIDEVNQDETERIVVETVVMEESQETINENEIDENKESDDINK